MPGVRKGRRGQGNWEGDRARGRRDRKVGFLALVVRPKSLCPLSLPFQLLHTKNKVVVGVVIVVVFGSIQSTL